jgi:inhibitor of KinA
VPNPPPQIQIAPLGDCALLVRVRDEFDDPNDAITAVLAAQRAIEAAQLPGIIELAPAYTTVAVFYDPILAISAGALVEGVRAWLKERISVLLASGGRDRVREVPSTSSARQRAMEIPICYEPEFAPDLEHVARNAGLSPNEVVELHSGAQYRVSCVGFTPGFQYLSGLPSRLATPRRATPRKEIPAGSVAIGGSQTGIYPIKSPGGWNVIGRTPVRLFDAAKYPPVLLGTGHWVRFRAITREEFNRQKDERLYSPRITAR